MRIRLSPACAQLQRERPQRGAGGFTMIELMLVISVLVILVGIAIIGFARVGKSAQEKQTRANMQVLMLLQSNYQDAARATINYPPGATPPVTSPLAAPGSVVEGGVDRFSSAVGTTDGVVEVFQSALNNAKVWDQIKADQLLKDSSGNYGRVMLDAWGNPMIYVPQQGLGNVTIGGANYRVTSAGVKQEKPSLVVGGEASPFWASAGPDGNFQLGDDNIYSFDN